MRPTRAVSMILVAIGLLSTLVVAGCGGAGGASTPVGRPSPRAVAGNPPPPTKKPQPVERRQRGPVPRCRPSDLVVLHERAGDGALSTYHTDFTVGNLSGRACSVSGFPRLYAIGADGRQVGGGAHQGLLFGEEPEPVTIAAEDTATFKASWREDVYSRGVCRPTVVARYRVLLPGARHPRSVPFPDFHRCTNPRADRSFSVGRIEPTRPAQGGGPAAPPRLREARPGEHLPHCRPSQLLLYTGVDSPAGAGLGTSYFRIDVANLSGHACEISGTPRVVAVALDGRPVGPPASPRTEIGAGAGRRLIRVARIGAHGEGAFIVSTGEVYNYGRDACGFVMAAGLQVRLPGSQRTQTVPMMLRRCPQKMSGGSQLSNGAVE